MKSILFHKIQMGLALLILAVFPLAAQVDVNPLPLGGQPGRVLYKDVNELGRAALKAVAMGDYAGLLRMTAYGMTRKEWQALANEFKAKAVAKLKADKNAPADEVKRKLQRLEEKFNDQELDRNIKSIREREKRFQDGFKKLRQEGKAMGIDWGRILFKAVDRNSIRKSGPAGMEEGDLYAVFSAGKKVYHLELDRCLHSAKLGWLIGPGSLRLHAGVPNDNRDDDPDEKGAPNDFEKGAPKKLQKKAGPKEAPARRNR